MATSTMAPPSNVIDCIRSWTPEEKDAALVELIGEAIRINGNHGPMPITKPNGESLGHIVPEAVSSAPELPRVVIPHRTQEQRERTQRALANLDDTFVVEEYFAQLSREDRD